MTQRSRPASELTVHEQASLTSGADFWSTKAVERVGVPSIMMTDGPHGLRKQTGAGDHLGLASSVPATCFPPAAGLASSFDADLVERVGAAIGREAAIEDVAVVLGPGINIKRSPLCGRNFEYYSEDPIVAGVLGAAAVRGIQSQGVGASLKHFAANNQETDRLRVSADVDPRPLREIYLRGFERVVTEARPWTVMCAYNRINGVYASEDPWLLTQVLRDEWGFDGLVVSDWGAVEDRVAALAAGLDLEMPASGGRTDAQLVDAVEGGRLAEGALETAAQRVIDLVARAGERPDAPASLDVDAHHALAREAAGRSIVLLKNDGALLPLRRDARVAVIGAFAAVPRYQGAGSSLINPTRLDTALEEIRALSDGGVVFAAGFALDAGGADAADADRPDAGVLVAEAVAAARDAETAVVFVGLPAAEESEGFDREHIDLPAEQLALLDAVLEVNPRTVVVLSHGGVVALPFRDRVPAIVDAWLLGQAGGGATADVLFGEVNPSGKLAETIPLRLADTPAYGNFPGEAGHVRYGEGLFVGYRWYDARQMDIAYPFGHGLSYTSFAYGAPAASVTDAGDLRVALTVTNTGDRAGREVVQVYTSLPGSAVARPPRELKAFASVALDAGETREVELLVARADLAYWDVRADRWVVEGGDYLVAVAASSRDIRGTVTVPVAADEVRLPLTMGSSVGELLGHPVVGPLVQQAMGAMLGGSTGGGIMPDEAMQKMIASFPIGRLAGFPGVPVSYEQLEQLVAVANGVAGT
ncbi:glycoside hydrolase family 3 C-terminal domain-containing protein [Microbacterium sp. zg.Y625]|uniref:glycoside hydrolase family 3 C-terminal domain-containing protein n=1 Tax=Microbacterium jiangjiandongii TaxID=3049071 RepID=UPI00214CD31A|nr:MULTISPECIES: glycoside hydrolase family 3 C-terminal domain-containing protein [unclassified Microbacterium]MCR2792273.1 glycoside hydrolase family 3 C-terminal domain-containing protein [Microbacterium sp. zg.Y625]MCR2815073.1 glycoside hydrolase family 3 C-terminal domain-containing protein [Microbacterium sp. zg.Y843]WIM25072.1 glycoside hydrolase family 3 C-terminal domain-containing protein [Microbacterium sp. zg-Y625]